MKVLILSFLLFSTALFANSDELEARNTIYNNIYKINQFSSLNYPKATMMLFANKQILPMFDIEYMSQKILENIPNSNNKIWLISKIKNDIVNTIMHSLSKARGRLFTPVSINKIGKNINLKLRVRNININLIMHKNKSSWKIFDIYIGNQSLIGYYKGIIFRKFIN